MRTADVYLRQGRVFVVGRKGASGRYVEAGPPVVVEPTVDTLATAIVDALATSVIPCELPPRPPGPYKSLVAVAAGVKSESAFNRSARLCVIRETDSGIDVLRGFPKSGGWHCAVIKALPLDVAPRDLAAAVLDVLRDDNAKLPIRGPKLPK